ncbi:unnamed protein product [Rodentolepis nana]|uniref:Replication protein A subunit n=1 Tax=Rodentolepis nana TaxID=102285 RepID=A0A0R3T2Y4_RODNA|nr:unnamed protein product [Rodentolepis nana]
MQSLTVGAIEQLYAGKIIQDPILKVLGFKNVPGANPGQNRYRLLITDGVKSHSFAMLATQLNCMIENNELKNGSIVRLKKYVCNNVQQGKFVVIVLDLEIVGYEADKTRQADVNMEEKPVAAAPAPSVLKTPPKNVSQPFSTASPGTPAGKVFAIRGLNPYQSRWTIRARVTQKGSIRTWNKNGREGKLFSFTLLDSTGEIRATAFNAEVDRFFDLIEVNKVFYISKASLKPANRQFNNTDNDYEMNINADTQIVPCDDGEDISVPGFSFKFVKIGKLDDCKAGDFVDIVGIVHEAGDLTTITMKTSNRDVQKRELGIVDDSGCLVRLTLWGQEAANFDGSNHPAIVVRSARVSDFNGRSLSATAQSTVMIAPSTIPEANKLKGWYDNSGGSSLNFETYRGEGLVGEGGDGYNGSRDWNLLSDLEAPGIGGQAKADYFTTKATVTFLKKENFMYQSCVTEGCQKKVVDLGNGLYRCEKCNRESPIYKWRLMLSLKISDITGEHWITCFQNTAEVILGRSADDLGAIKESKDEVQMENVFVNATFKSWVFRLRAKVDTFNDESRLRVVAVEVKPVNYAEYGRKLQKQIDAIIPSLPAELTMDDQMI